MKWIRLTLVCSSVFLVVASTATSLSSQELAVEAETPRSDEVPAAEVQTGEPAEPDPGELQMRALAASYPSVIRDVMFRDGDWAVRIDDEWYYWADGRVLPGDLRQDAEHYVGIRFYNYQLGTLQKRRDIAPELEPALRERTQAATSDSDDGLRFNDFLDTLYGVSSLAEAERTMESVQFLGKWIRVHPFIVAPLEHIQAQIRKTMVEDHRVREFVSNLESVHSYNWRNIAGTMRRSYHSYGVAIDLVPSSYDGKWAYWLWAAESGVDEWWKLALSERLFVPQPVIDAFEAEGFIWGGKWLFFDNLHFEYRPESIALSDAD